jgi:D-alanyl-lipoteichoic acid acyltransferase DltB (MBOAT superfamily)
MLFNSLEFLIFFPLVVALYYFLPQKYRWALLLIASCYFYMVFVPVYILILGFTIVIDYFAGIILENAKGARRKMWLIASIFANVGVLAIFKYYNFLNDNLTILLRGAAIENPIPYLSILLPIGLSFHTFQAMSYTIEVYRHNQKAERNFGVYALYVMFFPQLVAGPIERPQNMLHQFHEEKFINYQNITDGIKHIIWGLFKKVVIADRLAEYVNVVYGSPGDFFGQHLIIATVFFSFQIYCDFSGYSEIAIGTAKILGINLMMNFRRPYLAANIREFWQRWHISLSTWFRDYLYFPLGGNRVSKNRHYFNIFVVFLVSGLWHGANWTYVIWGALHGFYQVFGQLSAPYRDRINNATGLTAKPALLKGIQILTTFVLAAFAWIFFRASSLHDATIIIKNLLVFEPGIPLNLYRIPADFYLAFGSIAFLFIMEIFKEKYQFQIKLLPIPRPYNWIAIGFIVLCIFILGVWGGQDFIYFQF